jgi:two-component system, NarL family, response regulator
MAIATEIMTQNSKKLQIVIVDDHPAILLGLSSMLSMHPELHVAAALSSGQQLFDLQLDSSPDLFLMDLRMPGMSGTDCIRTARMRFPNAHVLVITSFDMDEEIFRALAAGAHGFITKNASQEEMLQAIHKVCAGKRYLPHAIASKLSSRNQREQLSSRELEILALIAKGLTNKQIASQLSISQNTVRNHVNSIIGKLQVQDRTEAAVLALKQGILSMENI